MRTLLNGLLGFLLLSIQASSYAQDRTYQHLSPEDKLFTPPPFSIKRTYYAALGKGNRLQAEFGDVHGPERLRNIDSILMVFLSDLKPFRDSLANPLTAKRIDYLSDASGHKKMRLHQLLPPGSTFLLGDDEPARLRLRQDTIYILLVSLRDGQTLYDRIGFFINSYDELEGLVTAGLGEKLREMKDGAGAWSRRDGDLRKDSDPSITEKPWNKLYLRLDGYLGVQNYKNYFVPSASLGATVHIERKYNIHTFSAWWEPGFFFGTSAQGRSEIYRNDFVVLRYGYDRSDSDKEPSAKTGLYTNISIGYLVRREGTYFPEHSFRLSAGDWQLKGGKLVVEPLIYFNDFFRGVTPGLRVSFRAL
jgi:hypothetical protein